MRNESGSVGARRHGFGLLVVLAAMGVAVLSLGLVIDLSHLYLVRNTLGTLAGNAALAAAYELDGTWDGIWRARQAAADWRQTSSRPELFGSFPIVALRAEFATGPEAPYAATPASAAGCRFVRVTATAEARLFFMPMIPGVGVSRRVSAAAVAGQRMIQAAGEGLAPLSPAAPDPGAPDFGFVAGQSYLLEAASPQSASGYVDVGQSLDEAGAEDTVVNGSYYLPEPLGVGKKLQRVKQPVGLARALRRRFLQDTDTAAVSFPGYAGNGRRILVVPVNDGSRPPVIVGFAAFLLPARSCRGPEGPCQATYINSSPVLQGKRAGAGGPGLYQVGLVR